MNYPDNLPAPLQAGYAIETVSPFVRSELASGRARQRQAFDSVPQNVKARWTLTIGEAQLFVTWFRHGINNGTEWFDMPLRNEFGCQMKKVRFASMYKGPTIAGPRLLSYTAELEIYERETQSEEWIENDLGEWLVYGNIFDVAMNRKWPED